MPTQAPADHPLVTGGITTLIAAILQRQPALADLAKTNPTLYAAVLGAATAAAVAVARQITGPRELPPEPGAPPTVTPYLNSGFRLP